MKVSKLLIGIGLTLTLASCADESPFQAESSATGQGGIKLSLKSSADYSTSIPKVRAAEIQTVTPPPASAFQIRLAKVDGSYAQTWSSLEEFAKEDKFSVGVYELEAFYGTKNSQGVVNSSKGYENAYYYGKIENITVLEGQDTPVSLSASLANSLVMVEYTDAFKSFFSDWSTTLQTSGPEDVVIGNKETMAYVTPGDVDIVIDAVLQNGKSYFLNPALFVAEPQHLYKIKYNIFDGEVGNKVLEINFNDDPTGEENVYIELNDQLASTEAPVITPNGFTSGDQVETQVGVPLVDKEIKMSVFAPGGLQKAIMKVVSSTSLSTGFLTNGEIDLCKATSSQQSSLASSGIKARGFFDNPDKMAHLDLTEFSKYLPAGRYTVSLQVTDKLSQTNTENVEVTIITVNTNSYIIEDPDVKFGETYADVMVSYDGPDPTQNGVNPFSFKLGDIETGTYMPVEILGIGTSSSPLTKAYTSQIYTYRLRLPEKAADYYPIEMYFNEGSSPVDEKHQINIVYPSYELEYDAFAKKLKIRFASVDGKPIDETMQKQMINRLRLFIDNTEKNISFDSTEDLFLLNGLNPNQDYNLSTTLKVKKNISSTDYMSSYSFKTENDTDIPNGDFNEYDVNNRIEINNINVGSAYTVRVVFGTDYQNKSSIIREVPFNWSTLNNETCYISSTRQNTWYLVPSTFLEPFENSNGNYCTIRNVAYSHNGESLSASTGGKWQGQGNTNYYGETTPNLDNLSKAVGELCLGQEIGNELEFNSRPSKLRFDYSYMCYNNGGSLNEEKGYIEIKILDTNKNTIVTYNQDLECTNDWSLDYNNLPYLDEPSNTIEINLDHYEFGKKAAYLYLTFKSKSGSGIPNIYMPTGSLLSEGLGSLDSNSYLNESNRNRPANSYHAFCMGSELKIANVHFEY